MRVFLADPALLNYKGHYYNYTKCLIAPFQEAGHDVHVLGNKKMLPEVQETLQAVPAFTHGHDHQAKIIFSDSNPPYRYFVSGASISLQSAMTQWHTDTLFEDLSQLHQRFAFSFQDLFIINSLTNYHFHGLVEWAVRHAKEHGQETLPQFVVILHFSLWPTANTDDTLERAYRHIFDTIIQHGLEKHFICYTDSPALSREYSLVTSLEVGVLPIPHGTHHHIPPQSTHVTPGIAYSGVASTTRGFHFLPYVVDYFRHLIDSSRLRAEFHVQLLADVDPLLIARDRLKRMPVTLHEGTLASKEYYDIFERADIYLLPYLLDYYHSQTSGVFAEAVSFGKIVIVPRGSWMAQMAEQFQTGKVFLPGDPKSLCEAIASVLNDFKGCIARAKKAAELWNKTNSPTGFIAALAQRIEGIA